MQNTQNIETQYITYEQLERHFGIKRGTAYALVSQKRIPHTRLGNRFVLFNAEEIKLWLSKHAVSLNQSDQEHSE